MRRHHFFFFFFFANEGSVPWETKCIGHIKKFSPPEPLGLFLPNMAQTSLGKEDSSWSNERTSPVLRYDKNEIVKN